MTKGSGLYRVMPCSEIAAEGILARAVEPADIEAIRCWRNAQIDVLRQSHPISHKEQVTYYEDTIWPDKSSTDPTNILLVLFKDNVTIGCGGLVHITWHYGRAEVSFLLDPVVPRTDVEKADLFSKWLEMMKRLAFRDHGLTRLATETFAMRKAYFGVLERSGFQREGQLRHHVRVGTQPMDGIIHGYLTSDGYKEV